MKVYKLTTYKWEPRANTSVLSLYQEHLFSSYDKAHKTAYLQGLTVMPQAQTQNHCTIKEIEVM